MKSPFIIFGFIAFVAAAKAQTGIGTTSPVNKLDIVSPAADASSSGTASNGNLRIGSGASAHVLDFGLSSSSTYGWLQARSKSNYATNYNLILNPNGGNVGIGSTAPSALLEVGSSDGSKQGEIVINPASTQYEGGQLTIKKSVLGSNYNWTIDQYSDGTTPRLRIFAGPTETNGIIIKENGYVGIGTYQPSVSLQVNGDIIANSIAGSSDRRFKKNIVPLSGSLNKILSLQGVGFDWRTDEFKNRAFSSKHAIGFIAQDVEKIVPEVVTTEKNTEGYKAVQYDKLVALLVEAIKEQQKQLEALKLEVEKLKKNHE